MEAPHPTALERPESGLRELFGDYKAEWLRDKVFDLFTEPSYFGALEGVRPCVLIGGRGTGKTTVLLRMAYEGAYHFSEGPTSLTEWDYIGLYYRVDSNRVAPFRGSELSNDQWQKVFAHFFNLLGCTLIIDFLAWYQSEIDPDFVLPSTAARAVAESFGVAESLATLPELNACIRSLTREFEFQINNVGDRLPPQLSVPGRPIQELTDALTSFGGIFAGKVFTFLLDEYENFDATQQTVLNSLVKHAGNSYTFKIGVKQGGFRTTETLAPEQRLQSPADYAVIDITDHLLESSDFPDFAERVCNARLKAISPAGGTRVENVIQLFESMTSEEEASRLGVRPIAEEYRNSLLKEVDYSEHPEVNLLKDLEIYVMAQLAKAEGRPLAEVFHRSVKNPLRWNTQYSNYRQAFLYTIKAGKTGVRKYYCGWDTVVQLAAGNIRFLMELVERCFVLSEEEERSYGLKFDPDLQTRAFQAVGRQAVLQLSSAVDGARLTRLVLGLGRVFGVLAADPTGHTPEVTQFKIAEPGTQTSLLASEEQCTDLLNEAVMELVLLRQYGTKLTSNIEPREFEYRVHPIFSPFFVIPPGKKRRMQLRAYEVLELASDTRSAIRNILQRLDRLHPTSLADQMDVFGDFYGADA